MNTCTPIVPGAAIHFMSLVVLKVPAFTKRIKHRIRIMILSIFV